MSDESSKRNEIFRAGPTREQVERADQFLANFAGPEYKEKRDVAQDYRTARLELPDAEGGTIEAMVSLDPVDEHTYFVVLSRAAPERAMMAKLSIRRPGNWETWKGQLDPQHPGRRDSDRVDGQPMMVSFFHRDADAS